MKRTIVNKKMFFSMLLIFVIFFSCEYKGPEEYVQNLKDLPKIICIEPADTTGAPGALTIKIIGENFSKDVDKNFVYFDNGKEHVQALNRSATDTAIVVHRPPITGDSVMIKVSTQNGLEIAEYFPYKLDAVTAEYGGFGTSDELLAIAMDADENLYVAQSGIIIKITPDGERAGSISNTKYKSFTDMKIGPDGYIYFLKKPEKVIYKADPNNGGAQNFCSLPEVVSSFDFDENDNIFSGGKKGLFLVRSDGSGKISVGQYSGFNIRSIRVFEGYVYVAAEYAGTEATIPQTGIWKNEILSDSLGENILVLNWAQSGNFSESNINAITFSQDGDMYIATDNTPNPILIVHSDGTSEPLFPGTLTSPASNLIWGNGNFLYMLCGKTPIYRITTDREGAPYYGRQ